eukprot:3796774-Rhodomonas_salina.1
MRGYEGATLTIRSSTTHSSSLRGARFGGLGSSGVSSAAESGWTGAWEGGRMGGGGVWGSVAGS